MATGVGVFWPENLPCWLLDSHEGQDEDIYARTEVDYGPARLRRMYVSVPQIRKAALFLHGDEPRTFHDFFETALDVGARRFIAPFRDFGGIDRYYECEFVEPYDAEYVSLAGAKRAWRVQCQFRLYGDGDLSPEFLEPAQLSARFGIYLRGSANATPTAALEADFGISLTGTAGANRLGNIALGINLGGRIIPQSDLGGCAFMIALAGQVQNV